MQYSKRSGAVGAEMRQGPGAGSMMLRRRIGGVLVLALSVLLASCGSPDRRDPVTMVELLAHPYMWDGRMVVTSGFLLYSPSAGFGRLYMTHLDAEYELDRFVPIDLRSFLLAHPNATGLQGRYVYIDGRFRKGYPIGWIEDVQRVTPLRARTLDDCRFKYQLGFSKTYPCWADDDMEKLPNQ